MDSKRNFVELKLNRMNKEKKHLIELLNRINNTKKELKQLNKEYKAAFADVCKSWVEQTRSLFPNLQPCDIGEYVGVDIVLGHFLRC